MTGALFAAPRAGMDSPRAGSFSSLVGGMGAQGASVAQLAILNGVEENESIAQGRLLKTVTPPKLR